MRPINISMDLLSAKNFAENGRILRYTKYIDIRHHFLHNYIEKRNIVLTHVAGTENPVDILMKLLAWQKFEYLKGKLCMVSKIEAIQRYGASEASL